MPKQKNRPFLLNPYEGLAPFYDLLMKHVNYKQWARHIKSLFFVSEKKIKSLVDLSCGTGSHLLSLRAPGRIIFASDLSLAMLKQAKNKNPTGKSAFINASFYAPPFAGHKFDAALALYDSVNYILDDRDVLLFLQESRRILNHGGLLIFDVVTPYTCIKYFIDYHEKHFDRQEQGYERKGWFDRERSLQFNEFIIKRNGRVYREKHKQRIRSVGEWTELVADVFYENYRIFGDFSLRPPTATAERVHFVCEKK